MLSKNDIITLEIVDLTAEAMGVCHNYYSKK